MAIRLGVSWILGKRNMIEELVGQTVVIDLRSAFVCMGVLLRVGDHFLELADADMHDLRDTSTSRENYIAGAYATGIKRNRKKVFIRRDEVVGVSRLEDVVDE
jgi:hypothetical protein